MRNTNSFNGLTYLLASLAVFAFCGIAIPVRADTVYRINVDTSSIIGISGFIDLQLNPEATPETTYLRAEISGFNAVQGSIGSVEQQFGGVSGGFPSVLILDASDAYNVHTQAIEFGKEISFVIKFSGDVLDNPSGASPGASFFFSLLDANQDPLLSNDAFGTLVAIHFLADGTADVQLFPPDDASPPLVTMTQLSTIPEPSSGLLLGLGALAIAGFAHLRR